MLPKKHFNNFRTKAIKNTKNINIFGKKDCDIKFSKALKSVDTGDLTCFTNFFPSKKCNNYKFVKKNINDILSGQISLADEQNFEMKLVQIDGYFLEMKIKEIIKRTTGERIQDIPELYKFKEIHNKELQYYIVKIDSDNFEVKFIDIYHLVIPSPNKELGEITEQSKVKYHDHKMDKICLSEIKKELNIQSK